MLLSPHLFVKTKNELFGFLWTLKRAADNVAFQIDRVGQIDYTPDNPTTATSTPESATKVEVIKEKKSSKPSKEKKVGRPKPYPSKKKKTEASDVKICSASPKDKVEERDVTEEEKSKMAGDLWSLIMQGME